MGKDSVPNFTEQQIEKYRVQAAAHQTNHSMMNAMSQEQLESIIIFPRIKKVKTWLKYTQMSPLQLPEEVLQRIAIVVRSESYKQFPSRNL